MEYMNISISFSLFQSITELHSSLINEKKISNKILKLNFDMFKFMYLNFVIIILCMKKLNLQL